MPITTKKRKQSKQAEFYKAVKDNFDLIQYGITKLRTRLTQNLAIFVTMDRIKVRGRTYVVYVRGTVITTKGYISIERLQPEAFAKSLAYMMTLDVVNLEAYKNNCNSSVERQVADLSNKYVLDGGAMWREMENGFKPLNKAADRRTEHF